MGLVFTLHINRTRIGFRLLGVCLILCSCVAALGQATPGFKYQAGAAFTVGIANTQFPFYADNAAGFDIAIFYQSSLLLGVQVKGGSYPYSARFPQTPITVGYRIGKNPTGWEPSLWAGWNPFAYIGAGYSRSEDSDSAGKAVATEWLRCVEASAGVDHQRRNFSWRVVEISWTETYAGTHNLRSIGASTGISYYFPH